MHKPITLVILAAGLGSRYGGIKQLDRFGPNGESLMEYALYDARKAGFTDILFVIRSEIKGLLEERIMNPYQAWFSMDSICQEINLLPLGYRSPPERSKPWGTGQAVLLCVGKVDQPFAVINADDFYGPAGYQQMATALFAADAKDSLGFINGYPLSKTLSAHGSVSRGVIGVQSGWMSSLVEHTKITQVGAQVLDLAQTPPKPLSANQPVSMNFWGFTPAVFPILEKGFQQFLDQRISEPGAEFYITTPINQAIQAGTFKVKVLDCQEPWLGVTHKADQEQVQVCLGQKHTEGLYPKTLAPSSQERRWS